MFDEYELTEMIARMEPYPVPGGDAEETLNRLIEQARRAKSSTDEMIGPYPIACAFNVSSQTVIGWGRRGLLPGTVFIGSRVYFRREQILRFIEAGGTPQAPY